MYKLTPLQKETMEFLKAQIDEARSYSIDFENMGKEDYANTQKILEAQKGIVYTPGGNVTVRTLRKLENIGLIKILEDNSGIGTGFGAFPSKVKVLNYYYRNLLDGVLPENQVKSKGAEVVRSS